MPAKILVRDIQKSFRSDKGPLPVLERISFGVGDGELVAVVGPSGCGKTTLISIIAGLLTHASERLLKIPGLTLVGTAPEKCAVVSFTLDGVHPHDLGTILDHQGVAIRTGHHCAMPVMEFFGLPATARASFSFYNTHDEVERLAAAVELARGMFA